MGTTFTPNDGSISALAFTRRPDIGNNDVTGHANIIAASAGGTMRVKERGPRVEEYLLRYTALTAAEFASLDTFLMTTMSGACEPMTVSWDTQTNLLLETRDQTQSPWSSVSGITTTFPYDDKDGGNVASRLVFNASSTGTHSQTSGNTSSGQEYTADVWIKGLAGYSNAVKLEIADDDGLIVAAATETISPTTSWVRYSVTATAANSGNNLRFRIVRATLTSAFTLYVQNPQLNTGGQTTYQPNEAAFGLTNVRFDPPILAPTYRDTDIIDVAVPLRRYATV